MKTKRNSSFVCFPLCFQEMQRTEIHWSPNDRNQLAEIGAEIIIHTFDRPLTGESGKCLSGGTNKKTTNLNYPLNEKSHIKCCAWWPSQEHPFVFAIGQPNGKIIFENVKDRSDPWSQERTVIEQKPNRACVALQWNPKHPNLLLSGFERSRNENCLTIWDINPHGSNSSSISLPNLGGVTTNSDEFKRTDFYPHHQPMWKPFFDYGINEQCHSLTWVRPNEKIFAACTTQHTTRYIRIYDHRASAPVVLNFVTKAPNNLCSDPNERYLAASNEKCVYVYDTRSHEKPLIIREENEPIGKLSWSRTGSSQLGYCLKDSPKFHLLSVSSNTIPDNDIFVHRILQCPIQRYRIGLASFDWNYFDSDRLVLLSGKEYFDYVIPSKSTINYSTRDGLLWTNGHFIYPSIISEDENQMTSKVLFNYDLTNLQIDRRNLSSISPMTSNHSQQDKIEFNLNEMGKDARSTIEQFQRWIRNTNVNRDPYPFLGVVESFRDFQSSSTTNVSQQQWISTIPSTSTKTVFDSSERQCVLQLCGWNSIDNRSNHSTGNSLVYDRINSLIEQDQYEKAASIAILQMNLTRALEILKMGINEGGKEELATLTLALIGFIRATSNNFDEKSISTEYSSMTKIFHRPYLRAMFSFICTSDGNDLQYQTVLDEELDLNDKVAFAVRYLNDQRLVEKLEKLAETSREKGDLQGILLTGLRQSGCELIQKYLDQTNDIRTAALLGIHVSEDVYQDCSYVQEWIEGYRLLLDQLQMWNERAEFDIYRNHSLSNLRRHFYENKSNLNSSQQNFCIFCQTSLDPTQLSSSSSSTTTSTNISTTNPIRSYHRSSQQILNRTSTSTTNSNYSSTHQSNDILTICGKCRQILPRCSICMMSLTTYIEDASFIYDSHPDKSNLMSSQWFTWCRLCRHGGHAEHLSNWFTINDKCPVAKCLCHCTLIDRIISS